ncbi:MAG: globin [Bacteriovoracia bacterium]
MQTIQRCLQDLTPHADNFFIHFYHTLFRQNPKLIEKFKGVKMRAVVQDAVKSFAYVRDHLAPGGQNERLLCAHLTNFMSRQTRLYRLTPEDFVRMQTAFECALEDFYGETWSKEIGKAWSQFFHRMAKLIDTNAITAASSAAQAA